MLIARAPVRLSLAGGGTDLEAYYLKHGGAVISTTLDKYFYVFVSYSGGDDIQVSSSDYRTFIRHRFDEPPLWEGDLRLPKAIIHHFGLRSGFSVFLASQVPPGTGLGSSSTVSVALIKALAVLTGRQLTPHQVAELACEIEITRLGMPIGKQDQYAATFGGLNYIEFQREAVTVERLAIPEGVLPDLERRLLLFFTGRWHDSREILGEQRRNSQLDGGDAVEALHFIKAAAIRMRSDLLAGDLSTIGELLHEAWLAKRKLASGISDSAIDRWYERALKAGAKGGKVAGAGGGGFLVVYCDPERRDTVTRALKGEGLIPMDFRFETGGAMVIMNNLVGSAPLAV